MKIFLLSSVNATLSSPVQTKVRNISEDTQKMPQTRSTALPWHEKKERKQTNKDNTYASHEKKKKKKKKKR